jgi:hypothetical protein
MHHEFLPTTAEIVGSLRDSEREAERRYDEAVKGSDLCAAQRAAAEWKQAADALTQFVAKHPDPYRDHPTSWRGSYASYRFCGHGPIWSAWRTSRTRLFMTLPWWRERGQNAAPNARLDFQVPGDDNHPDPEHPSEFSAD